MKEVLRIKQGMQDDRKDDMLRDYELDVFENDIVYIQGLEGSGIKTLISLLDGECTLKAGELFLWGEKAEEGYERNLSYQYKIYTITAEKDLVEELTVAENLEAVRYLPFPVRLYNNRKAKAKVEAYLRKEQVDISADACPWMLSKKDRQKLSILKAKMHGAKVIVLDVTSDICEGREAEELCRLIQRTNAQGVTFMILSECYTMFAEIASRIQIISQGRDLKEWTEMTDAVRQRLRYQTPEAYPEQRVKWKEDTPAFLGMYDYEWEMKGCIWDYLAYVRYHNWQVWKEYIDAFIPERGFGQDGDTVVIPKDSEAYLLKNLSIADNLIMPIPRRVSRNRFGVIKKNIRNNIDREFRRKMGIASNIKKVEELNRIQKKILSIYRFELNRPHTIILESPYNGMNPEEKEYLRQYLRSLSRRGMKIVYFSKSMEEIQEDCRDVIVTQNGEGAKMTTLC